MERLEGLSIGLDLETMKVNSGLQDLKSKLTTVNSEMKANMSAFDRSDRSIGKYETRLKGLNKKLEVQRAVTDKAKTSYEKMVKEHGEGTVEAEKAAREYNNQAAALNNLERYVNNATDELERMKEQQRIANSNWTKMGDKLDNVGGRMKTFGTGMQNVGSSLNRNVTMPLTVAGGIAIKTGMDFEAGMSKVQAVSGASADDIAKLETKAREMGSTTVFSAKEASDAFYYMSLAGWEATDMMDGISGVMDLAAASGEDLASVSDIVTDGLTAFGLSAKDSGRMADVLAAASSSANTDVKGLGEAFKYVAPVAGSLGYTMEDVSHAIGLMANSGIKSTQAGTALRSMLTRIAKPTGEAKKLMKEYGISLTDSEGNMKSLDKVMGDLRKSVGKLDKDQQAQAASTIFGQEAMAGALAIINSSEDDYKKLSKAIKESDGVAADMADTMQDNLAGSLKELRSMAEDLFIEVYKNLKPSLEDTVQVLKDLTKWFSELNPETQQNIIKFGLLAAAAGPVLSIFGKLTFGAGALMQGIGGVSKSIGVASGKGAAGSLALLGKAGVAGLAIAGVAGVTLTVIDLIKKSKEAEEVNLDVAQSLSDQAVQLENSAETFDKLSGKAKVSNEQLAELNDLNQRISESSNPGEIKALQEQYDKLAKNSGLSKDELGKLFEANKNIIDQAPDVQKSVSESGNAFVETTDAVKDQVQAMRDLSEAQIKGERAKLLEQEEAALKKINEQTGLLEKTEQRLLFLSENQSMSKDEIDSKVQEINNKIKEGNLSEEEAWSLDQQRTDLLNIKNDKIEKTVDMLNDEAEEIEGVIGKEQEKIDKLEATNLQLANIKLQNAGINAEGEEGLAQLDERLKKNQQELAELDAQLEKNGVLNEKDRERRVALQEIVGKQQEAKNYIYDQIGLYNDLNSLIDTKLGSLDKEKEKRVANLAKTSEIKIEEGNILKQMDKKNEKLLQERANLVENWKQEGANKQEIQEQINKIDQKIFKNDDVLEQILREAGLWDEAKDKINFGTDALEGQGSQIDRNNAKTSMGIGLEKDRTKEAGKDATKNIFATDNNTISVIDFAAKVGVIKPVDVTDNGSIDDLNERAKSPVKKAIEFVTNGFKFWATGTPTAGHPGGEAVLGDGIGTNAGRELVTLPTGKMFLSADRPTLYPDLPKGTHVMPARKTRELMRTAPKYADGTDGWQSLLEPGSIRTDFSKLLALLGKDKIKTKDDNPAGASSVEEKLDKLLSLLSIMKQQPEINQTLHFHSTESSPADNARKQKKASQDLAMEWRN